MYVSDPCSSAFLCGSHREAAIDLDHLPSYITSIIRKQKRSNPRYFVRLRKTSEWNQLANLCLVSLIKLPSHVCGYHSERQRIYSDFAARDFLRERLG